MDAQKEFVIKTIENGIAELKKRVDVLKEIDNSCDADVETTESSSYTTMRIELTVYHDWSEGR